MTLPRFIAVPLLLFPWILAVAGFAWLFVLRFPPSGVITFSVPFDGTSAWIDPFLPAERVTSPGAQEGGWRGQRILGDPVYGTVRVPGVFEEVDVGIEFRPARQPLLELGIQRGAEPPAYAYTPIWFEPLETSVWHRSASGEGYVRNGAPDAVLASSDFSKLLQWHASATPPRLEDPVRDPHTTRVSLRGAHDFWTVPAGGVVSFSFEFQDANRSRGNDAIILRVFRNGIEQRTDAIGIGGTRDEKMGRVFSNGIRLERQEPGIYRVQVITDDDVFIRSVTTPSTRWVVGPRLVFGDLVGYATTTPPGIAWSDSRHLVLETFHAEALQRVTFGSDAATLAKTHEQVRLERTDSGAAPQVLVAPKGDVRIIGDGWFAFAKDAFFAPEPRRVTDETDLEREGVTGLLTNYVRPEAIGDGWYRAHVRFTMDPSHDRTRISLAAPGIISRSGSVDIRSVSLTYTRPPLSWGEWWRIVRKEIGNAFRRIQP